MDGIDGLAGSQAVVAGLFGGAVFLDAGEPVLATASLTLAGGSSGFLIWNWPPAKIFMGDVGSGFLGFAFGALGLAGERIATVPMIVVFIPLGVFICDSTVTLFRRLFQGARVYEPHRSHVYQRLIQRGWSHRAVTLLITGLNIFLAGLAWWAWRRPEYVMEAVALGLALVVGAAFVAYSPWNDASAMVDS